MKIRALLNFSVAGERQLDIDPVERGRVVRQH